MGILMPKKNKPTDDWEVEVYSYDLYGHMYKWILRDDHGHVMAEGYCGEMQDAVDAADIMRDFYDERMAKK